jgi:hypothetical protein
MKGARSPMRKVACPDCGYTVRMARSWMNVGLPTCPCGAGMRPESPADLAFCGLIGMDDMSAKDWTVVCRENGWEDSTIRRGAAAKAHDRRELEVGGFAARRVGAAHCVFAGCGRWIAADADRCTAGHAQHEHALEAALPF